MGYDIRMRNIWSWLPDTVDLREETNSPSLTTSFPGIDWVPIMAAMSSPTTYSVMPCFPFSFSKYQRRDANKRVWRDYLDWLRHMGGES